ncbi:hypothetical protein GCM10010978_32320 [Compostibacillus humi]|uniref:Uncharacterized protein n=1 Tax=Compostibacillus humi TaxID=1245525 RepID=A0A8J2XGY0_9BACI|nr:hypothetical protein GCM10010978_32320 [Compostibacillus humi]
MTAIKQNRFEVGVYTLADLGPDPHSGEIISPKQRMDEIIEAAKLADELGLDIFASPARLCGVITCRCFGCHCPGNEPH